MSHATIRREAGERPVEDPGPGAWLRRLGRKHAPIGARSGYPLEQAEHMAREAVGGRCRGSPCASDLAAHSGRCPEGIRPRDWARRKSRASTSSRTAGALVGGAAQHHAVDVAQCASRLVQRRDAAIDDDGQVRALALQPLDQAIVQRRDVAVLLRRQALQPGLAGMDDEARRRRRRRSARPGGRAPARGPARRRRSGT